MNSYFSAVAAAAIFVAAGAAQAGSATVSGASDIWLAGQSAGAAVSGYFGSDSIPTNAPVHLNVTGGSILTFSATGSTSVDGGCFAGPNGGCYSDQSGFSPSPWSGQYNGPADTLIGVFLSGKPTLADDGSGYVGPLGFVAGLDYQNPANMGLSSLSPQLGQIFVIGDGASWAQQFIAPAGATALYLGVGDSIGGSYNNLGSLSVDFTGATLAVPEPATWAMLIFGVALVGAHLRRRTSAFA